MALLILIQQTDHKQSALKHYLVTKHDTYDFEYRKNKAPFCASSEASCPKSPHSFTVQVAIFAAGPDKIALIRFIFGVKPLTDGSLDVSCSTGHRESYIWEINWVKVFFSTILIFRITLFFQLEGRGAGSTPYSSAGEGW